MNTECGVSNNTNLSYWEWVVSEIENVVSAEIFLERTELNNKDLDLVISVLKDNVPFIMDNE